MNDIIRVVVVNGGIALLLVVLIMVPAIYYFDGTNKLKDVFIGLTLFGIMIAVVGVIVSGVIQLFST